MIGYKFKPDDSQAESLAAATTGTGRALAFHECRQITWTVEGAGTISGGTVVIETADQIGYAGTWAELDSITASTLSGGASYVNTFPTSGSGFVRGRISSDITGGGDVTVRLNGLIG